MAEGGTPGDEGETSRFEATAEGDCPLGTGDRDEMPAAIGEGDPEFFCKRP
jgi:hypothetical protein